MESKEKLNEGRKLIDALYELTKESFSVSDDTILDKLYVHIENKVKGNEFSELLRDFGVWLESVLKLWSSNTLSSGVKVLAIRLMGLVGSRPHGFTIIKHMLPEIEKLMSNSEVHNDSSLMVPLVNDLKLFLNHEEGFNWVLKTEIWKHAVKTFYEDRSIYINRSGINFITLLLNIVSRRNKNLAVEILNFVCEPLVQNCLFTVKPLPNLEGSDSYPMKDDFDQKRGISIKKFSELENVRRTSKYLCDILDETFSCDFNLPVNFKLNITTDKDSFNPPCALEDCLTLLRLLVTVELSNACWAKCPGSGERDTCPMQRFYATVVQGVIALKANKLVRTLLEFCVLCIRRIHRFRVSFPHIHNFSECSQCRELESMLVSKLKTFLEQHSACMCNSASPSPAGASCDKSTDQHKPERFNSVPLCSTFSFEYFQLGVFAIARSLQFVFYSISREEISSAVVNAFDIIKSCKSSKKARLFQLTGLAVRLTDDLYITQCISKQLFSAVTWVLAVENDDPRVTVSTLQLLEKILRTQVAHKLIVWPPEKAYFDFLIHKMPSISNSLMQSLENRASWEVRDTTLEVYQFIAELRELTPGIFCMIFDENLYSEVLELAAKDRMAYVRSSAFKLLATVIRVKLDLDKLSSKDLSVLAMKTLLDDEMPEPRMAACDLLSAMYVTNFLADDSTPEKLFTTVYSASMKELDWEAKKATLRFWQCTITKHLADHGVPPDPVWLSFNTSMTSEDVVLKIINVMDTMSDIGCFKVIWSDITDESDISVSEEASNAIENLLMLDSKWNFIDRIINSPDEEMVEENLAIKKLSSKHFFINIRQKDWREKIKARKYWIENTSDDLSSLLDHILNPDNTRGFDHNAVDCY